MEKGFDCQFPGAELRGQRNLERSYNLSYPTARNNSRAETKSGWNIQKKL